MYSRRTGFVLGFHGCDREIRDKIASEKGVVLKASENKYDWLGHAFGSETLAQFDLSAKTGTGMPYSRWY